MANTKNSTGRGRPAIGPRVETRVSDEVAAQLDAWAAKRNMTRPEAIRHLIVTGMQIGDAAATMAAVGRRTVESLFPEADDDIDAAWDLAHGEERGSFGAVESHPDRPYTITLGAIRARGHWIVTYERFDGEDWRNATRTMTVAADKAAAVELYRERLVELTDELWSEDDELPMWFEGVVGDYLGYEDTTITWKGLIPEAAVMAPAY